MRSRIALSVLIVLTVIAIAIVARSVATVDEHVGENSVGLLVLVPRDADATVERTAEIAASYLQSLSGDTPAVLHLDPKQPQAVFETAQHHHAGLVLVLEGDRFDTARMDAKRMQALGKWGFVLETEDIGTWSNPHGSTGATVVWTAGTSRLADQYAVYEFLRRLGVRFFHPEQEYIPERDVTDLRKLARRPTVLHRTGSDGKDLDYTPDFDQRSWSFHGPHPLEVLETFSDADFPFEQAVHVNDWIVKNRGNRGKGIGRGIASQTSRERRAAELNELHQRLGFPSGVGITLHNQQQGASAVIDRNSSVPVKQQIEDYVEQRLSAHPEAISFGIHFGPTEVTTTPDQETVEWINWAGRKALELRPDIRVEVNNHISGGQPTPHFDNLGCPSRTHDDGRSDYYDLAFHTDPRLSITVHTVMFYPLEGPARVYNQQSFAHKLCLMQRASAAGRPLKYFPEGSWWLSFDNPVPVYLPLYIGTRVRDIELLKPLLASRGGGTLHSHHMFNSGQEWGYWQQDYAVGLLHWNADVTQHDILGELLDPLCLPSEWETGCTTRTDARTILSEIIAHQKNMFLEQVDWRGRPGGLYLYFAGEDPGDEVAALAGFEFRPVAVRLDTVATWDLEALKHFRETDLKALANAKNAYARWLARLTVLRDNVPPDGLSWLNEIMDGVEINLLRAQHAHGIYGAVVSRREAELAGAENPRHAAETRWEQAEQALIQATNVIRRREQAYRYPASQTHGGGVTEQTAVKNGTTYGFRVHTKTHLLTYWNNRHEAARAILDGGPSRDIDLVPALAAPGTGLSVTWPQGQIGDSVISVGEHPITPDNDTLVLADEGFWPVRGDLYVDGKAITVGGGVARTNILAHTKKGGLKLIEPQTGLAQMVLKTVFPAVRWGWLPGPGRAGLVWAADVDSDGKVPYPAVVLAPVSETRGDTFSTKPINLHIPLSFGDGRRTMLLEQVVFEGMVRRTGLASPIRMAGKLVLADVVDALVELAGFDTRGAHQTLGELLKFDPDAPPQEIEFVADIDVVQ